MPFYEYECPHCGYHDEVLQKISDKPLSKCPSCGKKGLKKLISAPVFRLKGSGWYETDFKSDKENRRNLAGHDKDESGDKKSETKPESKSDAGKADAKPESKSESKSESRKAASEKPAARPVKRATAHARPRHKAARAAKRPRR